MSPSAVCTVSTTETACFDSVSVILPTDDWFDVVRSVAVLTGSLGASKLKVVGAAAAGGGAPKENVGAFALSLLASFFSSSSSSPQFVAFVSKSDMAARGVGEAAA